MEMEVDADEVQAEAEAKAEANAKPEKKAKKVAVVEKGYLTLTEALAEAARFSPPASISDWFSLGLHPTVLRGIADLGFACPTPIQAVCIPPAIQARKDTVGAAQTGSGKTLAFGLPILHQIMTLYESMGPESSGAKSLGLQALLISPTRELSLQITDHLKQAAKYTCIQIAPVVGGLSQLKQERLLSRRPEIVVGTPGRLWDMFESGEVRHLQDLNDLRFLVFDEADRLIDSGHFDEVANIIGFVAGREARAKAIQGMPGPTATAVPKVRPVQKYLFSATMTLQMTGKKLSARKVSGVEDDMLQKLLKKMDFRGTPAFIDLSNKGKSTASGLTEYAMRCTKDEKELHLFSMLSADPGRVLVFVNAISYVRRIVSIFKNLDIPIHALHADMQQKQRLKSMDRFKADPSAVMVATDVAARGLDIDNVDLVVHFHIPRTADTYVHRSGRTARAQKSGSSVAMISAEEVSEFNKLCHRMAWAKDQLPEYPVDRAYFNDLLSRLRIAREIDSIENKSNKAKAEKNWMQKNAEAIGFDISDDEDDEVDHKWQDKQQNNKIQNLRSQLSFMMKQPLQKSRKLPKQR